MEVINFVLLVIGLIAIRSMSTRLLKIEEKVNWIGRFIDKARVTGDLDRSTQVKPQAASLSVAQSAPEIVVPIPPSHLAQIKETQTHVVHEASPSHGAMSGGDKVLSGDDRVDSGRMNNDDPIKRFIAWLKEDFALKLGGLFVLLGMIWFAKLAIDNNWISEPARIAIGMMIGLGVLAFGWMRMRTYMSQGSIFLVLGTTIMIATTYVGQYLYGIPAKGFVSLAIMFLASAFVGFVAVVYKNKPLAAISLFSALVVPMLAGGGQNFPGLFAYLLATTVGSLILVRLIDLRGLIPMAQVAVLVYSLPAIMSYDRGSVLIEVYLLVVTFFFALLVPQLEVKRKFSDQAWATEVAIGILNVVMLLWWVLTVVNHDVGGGVDMRALILICWAVVFAFGGFLVARVRRDATPYLMQMIPAGLLIGIATYLQFGSDSSLLTLLWTGEISALLAMLLLRSPRASSVASWTILYIFPLSALVSLYSIKFFDADGVPQMSLVSFVVSLALIGLVSAHYIRALRAEGSLKFGDASIVHAWFAIMLVHVFFGVSKLADDLFSSADAATGFKLTVYTIVGLGTMVAGRMNSNRSRYWVGVGLLAFVTANLLYIALVENHETYMRIMTFIGIGILFMSTAFIGKKQKTKEE